jgi:hypothetical protein
MSSELDQARAHLRASQHKLQNHRTERSICEASCGEDLAIAPKERAAQNDVLAALSWVWDAQQRDENRPINSIMDFIDPGVRRLLQLEPGSAPLSAGVDFGGYLAKIRQKYDTDAGIVTIEFTDDSPPKVTGL